MTFLVSALLLLLALGGCRQETVEAPPIRDAVAILFVAADGASVRQLPSDTAQEIDTFPAGESVSVLAYRDEWAEIRYQDRTAWVRRTALTDSEEEARSEQGSTTIKFRRPPSPVYSQSRLKGEIVLEASVTPGGVVSEVRTLRNTTGSTALEMQNRSELLRASFYPLLVDGKPKAFIYEYRITY